MHLTTYLHVVNAYAHDLVIMIYAYLHEEEISWTCPEWQNDIAWSLLNPGRIFYYHWSGVDLKHRIIPSITLKEWVCDQAKA